jgi:hypothetical protein
MCQGETWWSRWVRPVTWRPAMPEKRAWWKRPTRGCGARLAHRRGGCSPAWRLIEATVVNTQTFASPGLEPQPLGLDVEPVPAVDRGDLEPRVAQPLGDRIGRGADELDRARHLPFGLDLLRDPGDGGVHADQPGLLPEAQQGRAALGGVAYRGGRCPSRGRTLPIRPRTRSRSAGVSVTGIPEIGTGPHGARRGAASRWAGRPRASRAPGRGPPPDGPRRWSRWRRSARARGRCRGVRGRWRSRCRAASRRSTASSARRAPARRRGRGRAARAGCGRASRWSR